MEQNDKNNEGIDLSGALKDPGKDKNVDEGYQVSPSYYPGSTKIIRWLIKYSGGLVKDEKQANYILIGFVALAIIVVLALIFSTGSKVNTFSPESYFNGQK